MSGMLSSLAVAQQFRNADVVPGRARHASHAYVGRSNRKIRVYVRTCTR